MTKLEKKGEWPWSPEKLSEYLEREFPHGPSPCFGCWCEECRNHPRRLLDDSKALGLEWAVALGALPAMSEFTQEEIEGMPWAHVLPQ